MSSWVGLIHRGIHSSQLCHMPSSSWSPSEQFFSYLEMGSLCFQVLLKFLPRLCLLERTLTGAVEARRGREWGHVFDLPENATKRAGREKSPDCQSLTILPRMLAVLDGSSLSTISHLFELVRGAHGSWALFFLGGLSLFRGSSSSGWHWVSTRMNEGMNDTMTSTFLSPPFKFGY